MNKDKSFISAVIENEGLEYAVFDYMDEEGFDDEKLAKLWKDARMAFEKLESYLKENGYMENY